MSIKNVWGGSYDINGATADGGCDNETSGSYQSPSEEVKQGWLLRPKEEAERKEQQYKYLKSLIVKTLLGMAVFGGILTISVMIGTHFHHHRNAVPKPDNYTIALHKALMFFDAQRSGRLPKNYNVPWRSNSCLKDEPVGGYYDSGSAGKNSFSASFSMTMLTWSVIEYGVKYDAVGELNHVKDIIKWGTDYLLKTFNSSSPSIGSIASQVGGEHDQLCWMRPEDIDGDQNYGRQTTLCSNCPALAAEMASALAAASIVFKNNTGYSKKLVCSAEVLFKFATKGQGEKYASGPDPPSTFYNSSGFWDEFVWGGIWLFFATGNSSYLQFVTSPNLIKQDNAFSVGADGGVFSWDKKYAGAQLLLSRIRIFMEVGYPYEATLRIVHNNVEQIMCSYLPNSRVFKQTKGGLIELNYGIPRPLQYVVNAAFLSTLFSDYLESKQIPGLQCGPEFYLKDALLDFARSQMDYILGKNPRKMSYIVGFGDRFPQQVFHRGSSIPNNRVKYGCKEGRKWRDSQKPNPNTIVGAMVAGPDKWDGFKDIRSNYNYTEPTIAGNAGLVAALVALSGGNPSMLDTNTIFSSVPPW